MKSKYKYESVTETVEIEIEESWGEVLSELDRHDYNIEHKETRRHCSLDALNLDDAFLASNVNLEERVLSELENEGLREAILKLSPNHRRLILEHFYSCRSFADIAKEDGVDESAIRHAVARAKNNLKKILI